MNATQIAMLLSQAVSLMNVSLTFAANSQKYRDMVARAVAEGRDLSEDELATLREDAQEALDNL